MAAEKKEVFVKLKKLEEVLRQNFTHKKAIIEDAKKYRPPPREPEGYFTKKHLGKVLKSVFSDDVKIEGLDKDYIRFRNKFFNATPVPDFFVTNSINVIGEVKYSHLNLECVGKAIGKIILYLTASKNENRQFDYGCIVCFDTSLKFNAMQPIEKSFKNSLWENENIYLIII